MSTSNKLDISGPYLQTGRIRELTRQIVQEKRQPPERVRVFLVELGHSKTTPAEHDIVRSEDVAAGNDLVSVVTSAEELKK
jgi:hypothetical protein